MRIFLVLIIIAPAYCFYSCASNQDSAVISVHPYPWCINHNKTRTRLEIFGSQLWLEINEEQHPWLVTHFWVGVQVNLARDFSGIRQFVSKRSCCLATRTTFLELHLLLLDPSPSPHPPLRQKTRCSQSPSAIQRPRPSALER